MTIAQQQTIADQASDWSQTLPFAQFDPANGTLDGVGISLTGDVAGTVSIESLEAAPATVTASLDSVVSVTSPAGVLLAQVSPEASASASLATDAGTTLSLAGTAATQALFQPGSIDLGNFVGTGSVPLTAGATSRLDVIGPANMEIQAQASAGASVTLQYDYSPPQNSSGANGAGAGWYGSSSMQEGVGSIGWPWAPQPVTTAPQVFHFADQTTGWTNSVPVQSFDPALGQLQSVNITVSGDEAASVAAENEDAASATLSTTQTATVSLDLPDGETAVAAAPTIADTMSLGGYDGTADFSGPSGQIDQGLTQTASNSVTLTGTADLALFSGTATVALPLSAIGTATLEGPGNLLARLLAQAGATVSVSYTYLPPATNDPDGNYAYVPPPVVSDVTVTTQDTWTNLSGGDWASGANWTSGPTAPSAGNDVAITQAGTYTITLAQAQTVDSVVLDASGAVLILDAPLNVTAGFTLEAGTLEFNGGSLSVGSYEQDGGLASGGTIDIVATGGIDLNAGTIDGTSVTLDAGTTIDVASIAAVIASGVSLATPNQGTLVSIGGTLSDPPPITWTNPIGGDWANPANWSSNPTEPSATTNVAITLPGTYGVTINDSRAVNAVLLDDAGATLTINGTLSIADTAAFDAGSVTMNGTLAAADAAAIIANAVTLSTNLGFGTAAIEAALDNTGLIQVNHGTLSLNGGGSSNAFGLQAAANAVLEFDGQTGTIEQTFSLTGGLYQGLNTVISGGALDASAASGVIFGSLQLAASGELLLGTNNAQANDGFTQQSNGPGGVSGFPTLSGTGTFTVFGGANLSGGQQIGTGLTRLYGLSVIGGSAGFAIDDGRTVENDGWLNWSSGNITLGNAIYAPYPLSIGGTLDNVAGATFYITASDARITNGLGGEVENAGVIALYAGGGGVDVGDPVYNTGYIQVQSGVLSLNGGGSSNAGGLYVAAGAELEFGLAEAPLGLLFTPATFTVTGGNLNLSHALVSGSTLDVSAAGSATFGTLRLDASGALLLGSGSAQTDGAFLQGPTTDSNASGIPFLSGSGTFTVFGGASLTNGVESGSGTTVLYGVSSIGGEPAFELDGGRTVQNEGWLNWSSGDITLGAGDASAATQSGTLTNAAGATFFITAAGNRIYNATGGMLKNAGVMAVYAGGGEVDIDATLANTGFIQVQSGTLSLNGGGTSDAGGMVVASGAVLQFGTAADGSGGTFAFTGGVYAVATTQIIGSTVDLSAASGAAFGSSLAISGGGALLLGGLYTGTGTLGLGDDGSHAMLSDAGAFTVSSFAELGDGVISGGGVLVLDGYSSIVDAVQLDDGSVLQNAAALDWTRGSIALGSGDAGAANQAGYINNLAGATFEIESDGSITAPGSGAVFNEGTIEKLSGSGTTSVQATIDNTGTVVVDSGTLSFAQAAIGDGTFDIGALARLDFAGVVDQNATIAFVGGGGTLAIDSGGFNATVEGFVSGDQFDFTAVQFTLTPALSFTQGTGGGTLAVSDGVHSVAVVMAGTYAQSDFKLSDDGNHGTAVSYT